jgi:hypothetical protein
MSSRRSAAMADASGGAAATVTDAAAVAADATRLNSHNPVISTGAKRSGETCSSAHPCKLLRVSGYEPWVVQATCRFLRPERSRMGAGQKAVPLRSKWQLVLIRLLDRAEAVSADISVPLHPSVENQRTHIPAIHAPADQLRTTCRPFARAFAAAHVRSLENPIRNSWLHAACPNYGRHRRPVLETVYPPRDRPPCGLARLIHSSTHNDYYYGQYLFFHSVS